MAKKKTSRRRGRARQGPKPRIYRRVYKHEAVNLLQSGSDLHVCAANEHPHDWPLSLITYDRDEYIAYAQEFLDDSCIWEGSAAETALRFILTDYKNNHALRGDPWIYRIDQDHEGRVGSWYGDDSCG